MQRIDLSLFDLIEQSVTKKIIISEGFIIDFIKQIVQQFMEFKKADITHSDIKPDNSFISTSFYQSSCYIGDFGLMYANYNSDSPHNNESKCRDRG